MKGSQTHFIRKAGITPATSHSLPGDITDIVLKRIVYLCLFGASMGALGTLLCFSRSFIASLAFFDVLCQRGFELAFDVFMILTGFGSAWLVHNRKGSAPILIGIGLGFGVYVAFWMNVGECFSLVGEQFLPLAHFSFSAVWLVFLPAIVPIRLRTTVIIVLLISIMPLLTRTFCQSMGWVELPAESRLDLTLGMMFAGGMGIGVSHVVFSLGKSVKAAREMGSYTLEENLGQGGMGQVWKASHRMLARPAAVKLIKPDVFIGMDQAQIDTMNHRFEHEVQSTAALYSPHTVDIYDYGVGADGTFFYVMELLDGIDMETLVDKYGPVDPARVAFLMIQACHSLNEAHNRKMIHRDIKPANLFVCRYGDDHDFVKVLDFGLVKQQAENKDRQKLTAEGVVTGTPAYMAPEVVSGKQPVDHRSDLYCLGCVAYWLLTGHLVFSADTSVALLLKHAHDEPVAPSQRSEMDMPADLDQAILACLAKDPEERPQSAKALAELLKTINFSEGWNQQRAQNWWTVHGPFEPEPKK